MISITPAFRQRGQAMVYGLFILMMCSAALFLMFNTGQLAREKTKLVNTADAVAYSAGILQARALNLDAYSNRALIANEVLVAQITSLSSWSKYLVNHVENTPMYSPECMDLEPALIRYAEYAPLCYFYYNIGNVNGVIDPIKQQLPNVLNLALGYVEVYKTILKASELFIHSAAFKIIRSQVMQEVADANYENDGKVWVDPGIFPITTMSDDWSSFTKNYKDDERQRLKDVVVQAANKDDFVRQRNWDAIASIIPGCAWLLNFNLDHVNRKGGTQMNGLDEWSASDQATFKYYAVGWKSFWFVKYPYCQNNSRQLGVGSENAVMTSANSNFSASSTNFTNYSGLPAFYDLNNEFTRPDGSSWFNSNDPRLILGVRVRRDQSQLRTTDGVNSPIQQVNNSRIGHYESNVARDLLQGKVMAAVSTAEVYFERPITQKNNMWANAPEKANLFNPFWRVRLIDNPSDVNVMRLMQVAP